jgi:hypothetical protein
MQESHDPRDDPLDAVLGAGGPAADDELRRAVLRQTTGLIRGRRRRKRCILAAGLLACYLAGGLTVTFWHTGGTTQRPLSDLPTTAAVPRPPDVLRPPPPGPAGSNGPQVAATKLDGYERWRRAGDQDLRQSGDISQAVRHYARALVAASDEQRAIVPDRDNWLLMALKDARVKETRHAQPQQN